MGLFDFFRRGDSSKTSAAPKRHGPHQTPLAPAPESAGDLARAIAQDVTRQLIALEHVDLDYTPMSLTTVEQILDRCSARGMRSAKQQDLVMGLGCYFGEIICRHNKGRWCFHQDSPLAQVPMFPPKFLHLVIPAPDGDQFVNVFNKIVARLDGDRGTSLSHYYKAVTTMNHMGPTKK